MTNIQPIPLKAALVINPKMLQFGETNALLQVSHEFIAGTLTLPIYLMPEQLLLLQTMLNQSTLLGHIQENSQNTLKVVNKQTQDKVSLTKNISFTKQEKLVLFALHKGLTYKQIAGVHFVSEHTVRSQVYGIYRKLSVHSRTEALNRVFG
jgi:DNA-binding NarL/FixJ family response regulator